MATWEPAANILDPSLISWWEGGGVWDPQPVGPPPPAAHAAAAPGAGGRSPPSGSSVTQIVDEPGLLPGWTAWQHVTANGRRYKRFKGPAGEAVESRAAMRRVAGGYGPEALAK